MDNVRPMPGAPRPNGPTRQFYFRPQCSCGHRMHLGERVGDICKPGEMTCKNAECRHAGKVYRAPMTQAQELYDLSYSGPTVGPVPA